MKKTGICPKCGGTDVLRIPGGTVCLGDSSQNFVAVGLSSVPVDRYVCCCCGFSEEWLRESDLKKVKKYWAEAAQ